MTYEPEDFVSLQNITKTMSTVGKEDLLLFLKHLILNLNSKEISMFNDFDFFRIVND